MKTYSNSSNANRAAKELAAKHDTLEVAKAIKQDDGTYVAAVHVTMGVAPDAIKGLARVVPKADEATATDLPDARAKHTEEEMSPENKVFALLKKTVANGCTLPEQESAVAKAREIVKANKLNAADFTWPAVPEPAPKADKPKTKTKAAAKPSGRKTKAGEAIELMSRKQGATADELIKGFGWLPHTLRGFVSLTNKKRRGEGQPEIVATRKDGVTTYKIG